MNSDSLLLECAALTFDVCVSYIVYKLYTNNARFLKSLKEAPCFELDNELQKSVENSDGVVKYAVITGSVKALTPPLRSQYVPYLQGVIQEKITREHKIKWSPFLRIWSSANQDHLHILHNIPFALYSKSGGIFKKQVSVEVIEPLLGKELVLPTIYDEFISHPQSIGDTIFGFFRGERTIGIQEIERLLCENETLTAVGKLVIENNKLKIKPPDDGLAYFVTPLTLESLINKVSYTTKLLKVTTIFFSAVSLGFFIYVSRHTFSTIKKRILRNREKKRLEEQRRLRRIADNSRKNHDANIPKCIVCLEYPVEVLILECGHACLCYSCSVRVKTLCPICRNRIERFVPTFWP